MRVQLVCSREQRTALHKRSLINQSICLTCQRWKFGTSWVIRVFVDGVNRVIVKEWNVIPTNTLFLTFSSPELIKEIMVSYLKVKVTLFVLNAICNYTNARILATQANIAKCQWSRKDKHKASVRDPRCAPWSNCNVPHTSFAQDCLVWKKDKQIQRSHAKQYIPFPDSFRKSLPQIELDGQLLNYKQNTKFWSVYISTKLNWRLHTENLINKVRKQLNFQKIVHSLGVMTQKRYYIYNIFSQIEIDLWSGGIFSTPNTLLKKLQSTDSKAIKSATGALVHTKYKQILRRSSNYISLRTT